jgi:cyclic pyranopterin phosphate synthase
MALDAFKREIKYLRLSLTDRCNYRCAYCVPAEGMTWLEPAELLSDDEIVRVLTVLGHQGVSKVRLTGGEPLVRPGLTELIARIKQLGVVDDLSLTTNGSLLAQHALALKQAGVNRINISLDTVDPDRFRELTCGGNVQDVLTGIQAAIDAGLSPVKINVVLTDAVQDEDVNFFQELVHKTPVIVRFIEYMPSYRCRVRAGMTVGSVTERLKQKNGGSLASPKQNPHGCGPARYLQGDADQGMFGFIAPISDGYCDRCNRIRLTADGRLRPCLLSDLEFDLRAALRGTATDEDIGRLFLQALQSKPSAHHLNEDPSSAFRKRGMSQIGG